MVIEKLSLTEKKKKRIFARITNKFINQQQCSKCNQSVQTATILVDSHLKEQICPSENQSANTQTPTRRRRSSLKTFLAFRSPKPIPMIHRTRRCSINLKTPKRLSSECLQVALIRKIQPVNHVDSSLVLPYKQLLNDETTSRDELFSIGPMKWSTPNRTTVYKTSSPYNNNSDQQCRLCTAEQLSFSDILGRSD